MTFPTLFSSISEFLATCQDYPYVMADSLLDVLTKGGHSRSLQDLDMVSTLLKKQAVYKWLWSARHSVLWDQGLASVTAELHSLEWTACRGRRTMKGKKEVSYQDPRELEHGPSLLILVRLKIPDLEWGWLAGWGMCFPFVHESSTLGGSERYTSPVASSISTCELSV